eukprot:scpid61419/ scgid8828/ Sushi, von Willebrand factor type A, EGF and pentraxin domain-containing protein 1
MHTVCFFPSPPRECRAVTCRVADVLACPHSKPLNVSSRFDYDSSLPITCASGYSTTKKGKATCQANKTALTICPDCQPTPCNTSKFQSPANAYTTQSGIVEVSKHLLIHCVKGYKPSAINMTSSAECLFGPNWQAINTTCDLIRCDPPPQAPANSNITVSGFMYGSTAAYSCAKHYIYVDGDTTLYCDAVGYQGVWKGTPILCKATLCNVSNFQLPANSFATQSGTIEVSKHLQTRCVKGYKPSVSNLTPSAECLVGPKWQPMNTTCEPVSCGPPPKAPANSNFTVSNLVYGSTVTYSCEKLH